VLRSNKRSAITISFKTGLHQFCWFNKNQSIKFEIYYRKYENVHWPKTDEYMFITDKHNLCSSGNRGT
jgi:hypothetical protein